MAKHFNGYSSIYLGLAVIELTLGIALNLYSSALDQRGCVSANTIMDLMYIYGKLGLYEEGLGHLNKISDLCKEQMEEEIYIKRQRHLDYSLGEFVLNSMKGDLTNYSALLDSLSTKNNYEFHTFMSWFTFLFQSRESALDALAPHHTSPLRTLCSTSSLLLYSAAFAL